MAKIKAFIICIFLLLSCRNSGIQDVLLEDQSGFSQGETVISIHPPTIDSTLITIGGEIEKVSADGVIIKKDTIITKKDTIVKPTLTLAEIYSKYIGVREKTGKNDGPEVEYFLSTVGLGKGYAWCAAYVKACLLEAGIKEASVINGMALSCENKKNIVYKNREFLKEVEQGDVFTLWYNNLGRIGHTGFHHKKVNSSVYETVEGNTNEAGSREGDGVYKKRRSYNATYSISRWK